MGTAESLWKTAVGFIRADSSQGNRQDIWKKLAGGILAGSVSAGEDGHPEEGNLLQPPMFLTVC